MVRLQKGEYSKWQPEGDGPGGPGKGPGKPGDKPGKPGKPGDKPGKPGDNKGKGQGRGPMDSELEKKLHQKIEKCIPKYVSTFKYKHPNNYTAVICEAISKRTPSYISIFNLNNVI